MRVEATPNNKFAPLKRREISGTYPVQRTLSQRTASRLDPVHQPETAGASEGPPRSPRAPKKVKILERTQQILGTRDPRAKGQRTK